jgi:alpha-L-fucosidase
MRKSLKLTFLLLIIILTGLNSIKAQWSILETDTTKNVPYYLTQKFSTSEWNASNFASEGEMKWFNEARFGMFIHFGLATYIGKDMSGALCYTWKAPDFGHGFVPDTIWKKYPQYLEFRDFNAKKWVETAQKAGMKYIVVIAKHHDGFHMWDTKYSDFKVTNTPFGRDYLKEIADACHAAGMKFGIYYSQRDWSQPFYSPIDTSLIVGITDPPYYKAKPGVKKMVPGPDHYKYIDYQFNVVRELCTKYGKVDIFWFDAAWWGGMFTSEMWESEKLTRMVRELQPGIIINNRASIPGDFDTPEQRIGMYQTRPWESCTTLCDSWSWSDTPVKTSKTLVKMLTSAACGNGNLLLSWGPRWDGAFDTVQVSRLIEVGDWLRQYGQTIYNTHGGPWYPEVWGGSTYLGNKVYLHITDDTLKILKLQSIDNKITGVKCLTGGTISYVQSGNGISFDLEKAGNSQLSTIVEITFRKQITGIAGRTNTE